MATTTTAQGGYTAVPPLTSPLQPPSSATLRPWGELFDLSGFALPFSLSEVTFRVRKNLSYFRLNYANMALIIFLLSLIYHPLAVIVFLFTISAWFYFYFSREQPLVVLDRTIDDRVMLIVLSLITFIALIWAHIWWNLFASMAISAAVICLHAAIRVPDDFDDQESPYSALFSVVDSPRGAYSQV